MYPQILVLHLCHIILYFAVAEEEVVLCFVRMRNVLIMCSVGCDLNMASACSRLPWVRWKGRGNETVAAITRTARQGELCRRLRWDHRTAVGDGWLCLPPSSVPALSMECVIRSASSCLISWPTSARVAQWLHLLVHSWRAAFFRLVSETNFLRHSFQTWT